ncbi:MAG: NADH:flavin oxidoreductase [Mycobacteriaceae bacterium]
MTEHFSRSRSHPYLNHSTTSASIFEPAQLGPVLLRNRVVKAATFEGLSPESLVTPELINFHRQVAAGGAGMTTVAYCAVLANGRTDRHQIWMRPEAIPGLTQLTEAVHAQGAAVSAQIGHAGPVANASSNRQPAIAPHWQISPLSLRLTRSATIDDLNNVIKAHAFAARMAADSGFDAVEIHCGHNYLLSSFLSPALNPRRDSYGGNLINRARLVREVASAVREEVGSDIAITAKLNMEDGVPGGLEVAESLTVAQWLESDGSLDALCLTAGSSLKNPMYLFRGNVPLDDFAAQFPQPQRVGIKLFGKKFLRTYPYKDAYLLDQARLFRSALTMPLMLLGGITSYPTMCLAMSEGFNFVAMARALLAEPNLINQISHGLQGTTSPPGGTQINLANIPIVTSNFDLHSGSAIPRSACTHCNKCMPSIYSGTRCVLEPKIG